MSGWSDMVLNETTPRTLSKVLAFKFDLNRVASNPGYYVLRTRTVVARLKVLLPLRLWWRLLLVTYVPSPLTVVASLGLEIAFTVLNIAGSIPVVWTLRAVDLLTVRMIRVSAVPPLLSMVARNPLLTRPEWQNGLKFYR